MSDAIVQKGTGMEVGFGSYLITGATMEEVGREPTAEIEPIKDENNATQTKLISDPGIRMRLKFKVKTGSPGILATIEALIKGSTLTVNSVAYMVEDINVMRTRKAIEVTATVVKEASMTYS